jgi:hypothetical protein
MYFALAHQPISGLPYCYSVKGLYLSSMFEINDNIFFGYKLNEYGGNYVNFDLSHSSGLKIEFSFHKDFKLGLSLNRKIMLTNLPDLMDEEFQSCITSIELDNVGISTKSYNVKTFLKPKYTISTTQLLSKIKKQITLNLKSCLHINKNTYIVYSGGLDSGTLAMLAQHNNLKFSALLQKSFIKYWPNLPFSKTVLADDLLLTPGTDTEIVIDYYNNIEPSFYQREYNLAINGYYGDLTLLHLSDLFHQCKHLSKKKNTKLYDLTLAKNYNLINSEQQLRMTILKLHLLPNFRHWFKNFQILDPYRDPMLLEMMLQLGLDDLIDQLGSANLQKKLIKKCNLDWLKLICDYKNDYTKFK